MVVQTKSQEQNKRIKRNQEVGGIRSKEKDGWTQRGKWLDLMGMIKKGESFGNKVREGIWKCQEGK